MANQKGKQLRKQVAPFEKGSISRSVRQIVNTIVPFVLVWILAYQSLSVSYFLTIPLIVIGAGLLVRVFIIFHDCTHYSFFKSRKANDVLGVVTGILTLFPYHQWQHCHTVHHATSGNLDKRGVGDIWVLTVEEYAALSTFGRLKYRLYRNPFVMFGLGPIFTFGIQNRFNRKGAKLKERLNVYFTNVAVVGWIALLCSLVGWQSFLLIHGPIFYLSGMAGIWLFYVQHTFEDSYYEHDEEWEYVLAATEGSSFYKLPKVLQWFTGNIGYHHVHHLAPKIPNYELETAHENVEPLKHVPTVSLATSLTSLKFRLWDEDQKRFVGYREVKSFSKEKLQTAKETVQANMQSKVQTKVQTKS